MHLLYDPKEAAGQTAPGPEQNPGEHKGSDDAISPGASVSVSAHLSGSAAGFQARCSHPIITLRFTPEPEPTLRVSQTEKAGLASPS